MDPSEMTLDNLQYFPHECCNPQRWAFNDQNEVSDVVKTITPTGTYKKTLESVIAAHADLTGIIALRDFRLAGEYSTRFAQYLNELKAFNNISSGEEHYYGLFLHDVFNGLHIICLIAKLQKSPEVHASNALRKIGDLIQDSQQYLADTKCSPSSVHNILVRELVKKSLNSNDLVTFPLQNLPIKREVSTKFIVSEVAITMAYAFDLSLPYTNMPAILVKAAVDNLLENATKAVIESRLQEGYVARIRVNTSYNENQIILQIQDNGMGMSEEFMNERLFQKHQSLFKEKSVGGHGEGLFYLKSLMKEFGGNITAESTINEGTTFKVFMNFATTSPGEQIYSS